VLPDAALAFDEVDPVRRLDHLAAGFLKKDGDPYNPSTLFKKALLARLPDAPQRYSAAAAALIAATDNLARYRMVEGTQAALTVADWLIARYEQLKAGRGFLDFNDLISRTVRLLARQDAGPWVQYKLDKGIDHILLDEAQDTSPDQWNVVKFLRGILCRLWRARRRRAHHLRRRRRKAVYLFLPGRIAGILRRQRHGFQIGGARRGPQLRERQPEAFVSLDERRAAGRRQGIFAIRGATRPDPDPIRSSMRRSAPARQAMSRSGRRSARRPSPNQRIGREAVDHATAPAVLLAERIATTIDRWLKTREIIEGAGSASRPATSWCWCASAIVSCTRCRAR
jgi:ATP-dependent helicase/nuclease subunit A